MVNVKKKERNSLQIISKFLLFFFLKEHQMLTLKKKLLPYFGKYFLVLNVIPEQNNKAIKAGNVCIANHHILSLHHQHVNLQHGSSFEARFAPELI